MLLFKVLPFLLYSSYILAADSLLPLDNSQAPAAVTQTDDMIDSFGLRIEEIAAPLDWQKRDDIWQIIKNIPFEDFSIPLPPSYKSLARENAHLVQRVSPSNRSAPNKFWILPNRPALIIGINNVVENDNPIRRQMSKSNLGETRSVSEDKQLFLFSPLNDSNNNSTQSIQDFFKFAEENRLICDQVPLLLMEAILPPFPVYSTPQSIPYSASSNSNTIKPQTLQQLQQQQTPMLTQQQQQMQLLRHIQQQQPPMLQPQQQQIFTRPQPLRQLQQPPMLQPQQQLPPVPPAMPSQDPQVQSILTRNAQLLKFLMEPSFLEHRVAHLLEDIENYEQKMEGKLTKTYYDNLSDMLTYNIEVHIKNIIAAKIIEGTEKTTAIMNFMDKFLEFRYLPKKPWVNVRLELFLLNVCRNIPEKLTLLLFPIPEKDKNKFLTLHKKYTKKIADFVFLNRSLPNKENLKENLISKLILNQKILSHPASIPLNFNWLVEEGILSKEQFKQVFGLFPEQIPDFIKNMTQPNYKDILNALKELSDKFAPLEQRIDHLEQENAGLKKQLEATLPYQLATIEENTEEQEPDEKRRKLDSE